MKYYLLSKGIPTTWSHLCLQRHRWGNYKINRFKRASSYGNLLGCIIYLLAWFYGWKIKRWSEKYIISLRTEKKWKVWFLSKSLEVNVFELMLGFVFEMDFEIRGGQNLWWYTNLYYLNVFLWHERGFQDRVHRHFQDRGHSFSPYGPTLSR